MKQDNNKKYNLFITVLFCAFIFGFGIALLIHMAHPTDFSEQENRYLQQAPEFKLGTPDWKGFTEGRDFWKGGNFFSGEFMSKFEKFVTDQFPLRDEWIQLKALGERALLKKENNGVYYGTDNETLFAKYTDPSSEELRKRVGYVNSLGVNLIDAGVPVFFSLVPDKSYVWADLLPDNAPDVDTGAMNASAKELTRNAYYFDLYDALDGDDSYYRTDHHWTVMGAKRAYDSLMEQFMIPNPAEPEGEPQLVSDAFFGTTWSSCGAGWIPPDEMHIWVPEGGPHGTITVTGYPEGKPIETPMYAMEKLQVKDKYAMYLGGNQPLCVLRNSEGTGKILVVRDSYSDSLAPFLALQFQEVHLWDLRYNNMSLKQYVQDNGIQYVLVLYSASNFSTDMNLSKLAR